MSSAETCNLAFEHIQQRGGRWCVVDIAGKSGRIRTVPIGDWVKRTVDDWAPAADISTGIVFRFAHSRGFDHAVARKMRAAGHTWANIAATLGVSAPSVVRACQNESSVSRLMLGKPLTPQAIFKALRRHAAKVGLN